MTFRRPGGATGRPSNFAMNPVSIWVAVECRKRLCRAGADPYSSLERAMINILGRCPARKTLQNNYSTAARFFARHPECLTAVEGMMEDIAQDERPGINRTVVPLIYKSRPDEDSQFVCGPIDLWKIDMDDEITGYGVDPEIPLVLAVVLK